MRAGIVTRPEEYRWSSHCYYALGREDHLVTAHEEYRMPGNDETARQQAYRELFLRHQDEKVLTEIREAVDRGWPLGSERFKDEIEAALQRAARPPRRGRPPRRMGASEM